MDAPDGKLEACAGRACLGGRALLAALEVRVPPLLDHAVLLSEHASLSTRNSPAYRAVPAQIPRLLCTDMRAVQHPAPWNTLVRPSRMLSSQPGYLPWESAAQPRAHPRAIPLDSTTHRQVSASFLSHPWHALSP
jgi:hypothetical protein